MEQLTVSFVNDDDCEFAMQQLKTLQANEDGQKLLPRAEAPVSVH